MNTDTESQHLPTHVAVCEQRYKALHKRLDRIERILWWWGTMIASGLIGIIIKLTIINVGG